jgi:hypothetical protein
MIRPIRRLVLVLLAAAVGVACSSNSPSSSGGGTNTLTVTAASPASGDGALTGITVTQSALSSTEFEVIIKGQVAGEYHSFDAIFVTATGAAEQIEHKWGTSDPINSATPDGWAGCVDPNCTANYSVDPATNKVTFTSLVLTGAGLGLSTPYDVNTSTIAGTVYWP